MITPSMPKIIAWLAVAFSMLVAMYTGFRWYADAPNRACQATDEQVLKDEVMNHLLRLAIDPVKTYNIDIEHKVKEVRALGQRIPDAIVEEGLNPGFRMTLPKMTDLAQVIKLPTPAIQARSIQGQSGLCEGHFPVQVSNGQILDGTLQWQLIDGRPHRFEFTPSLKLDGMIKQFGIDLNLPLYHLTHHKAKVRTMYYFLDPARQKAAEAEARSYKDRLFQKYGLSPDAVTFTVPITTR